VRAKTYVLRPLQPDETKRRAEAAALLVPTNHRAAVRAALEDAGNNQAELINVLETAQPGRRAAAAFLIATMPRRDRWTLSAAFLNEHLDYACRAWAHCPWSNDVPLQIFLQYVVPYAQLDERRDAWRADFFNRFATGAWACGTIEKAGLWVDAAVTTQLQVVYHATKRSKPNQSPCEAMAEKYASCTGLSILYADACRAAGIPARIVGVPLWRDRSGNHNWPLD
jgi:hypothetical protein